jgi:hypothetical protein
MSGFSNFLTNFSGGARIRSSDSSYNDLISQAVLVKSFNSATNEMDGFIYLSNLLIQFSASNKTGQQYISGSNNVIYFPIDTSSNNNFNPLAIYVTGFNNSGSNSPIVTVNQTWTGTSFVARVGGSVGGDVIWFSIGLAPTLPVYTNIRNKGSISSLNSVAVNGKGDIQYLCTSTSSTNHNFYKNSSYGYGSYQTYTLSTSFATSFNKIVCSLDGLTAIVSGENDNFTSCYYISKSVSSFTNIATQGLFGLQSIACSADANVIYGIYSSSGKGSILKNTNKSSQFVYVANTFKNLYDVATSSFGDMCYVSANSGIYLSNDSGGSFNFITILNGTNFNKITTNSTGQYVATCSASGVIYYSSNYGVSFSPSNSPSRSWSSITSNSTGQLLTASTSDANDSIYYSTDYGMTWSSNTTAPSATYVGINMNSAGNIATAITSSNVYVSFNAAN